MMRRSITTLVGVALASAASAQLSQSPGFTLEAVSFGGAGGGSCSIDHAAYAEQEAIVDDTTATSPGFELEVGFLTRYGLDVDEPGVFAVSPGHGTVDGGTAFTICGIHFDRNGTAGIVGVDIGGVPATAVTVLSDSTITAVTPAAVAEGYGPTDVTITTAHGAAVRSGGHVYSPGIVASPVAWQTGTLRLANYGPPGASFQTQFSTMTTSIPLPPFGTLLIGPGQLQEALPLTLYPAGDGIHVVEVPVPTSPTVAGVTLHFQSAAILSLAPLDVRLVNRQSTLMQ